MSDDPDVGWAEPWPRVPDNDDAWQAFVGSLDVERLRTEHVRVLGDLTEERPWSVTDIETRRAHAFMASEFWAKVHDENTAAEHEARRARYAARDEAIVEASNAAREADEAEAAERARAERELAKTIQALDEAAILEALARHERDHPRGHAA